MADDQASSQDTVSTEHHPKVFISYSWSNEDHIAWVIELHRRLMEDSGIDAILDRYDMKPGADKFEFMEKMVHDKTIDKVLVICEQSYAEKADNRKGGVGDETQIITPSVYESTTQTKFIPVIAQRDPDGKPYMPIYLASRKYFDLSNPLTFESDYEELVRYIHDKPLKQKPKIGKIPSYLAVDTETPLTTYKFRAYQSAVLNDKPTARGLAEDYLEALESALDQAEIVFGTERIEYSDYEKRVLDNLEGFLRYRNEYVDFVDFTCRYVDHTRVFEAVQRFFSRCPRFLHRHENGSTRFSDNYQFLIGELFLYTIALLIKRERFEDAALFLKATYHDSEDLHYNFVYSHSVFIPFMGQVEQLRARFVPSQSRNITLALKKLPERATNPKVTWDDLLEADYILYVRDMLREPSSRRAWWSSSIRSHILPYKSLRGMSVFQRAESKAYFDRMRILLNVESKEDLVEKVIAAVGSLSRSEAWDIGNLEQHRSLMQLDRLATH